MSNTVLSPDFAESFKTELTETTEEAMKIAGVLKESDLSQYIPYGDGSLSEDLFLRLQKTDQKKLAELIKENVINQNPKSYAPNRSKPSVISHDIATELEKVIERAMDKVKAKKESDLCPYISYRNKRLHHFTYGQLKKESPEDILNLIQEHILDKPPQKFPRKYRPRTPKEKPSVEDKKSVSRNLDHSLEDVINLAMKRKRLNLQKESDLCWFIPNENGGYLFYSTYRSLKRKDPEKLKELIQTYVVSPRNPKRFSSNPRKSTSLSHHTTTPEKDLHVSFTEKTKLLELESTKLDSVLQLLRELLQEIKSQQEIPKNRCEPRKESDEFSINAFRPLMKEKLQDSLSDRYFRTIQNQLIKRIRKKEVDHELWDAYVDLIEIN